MEKKIDPIAVLQSRINQCLELALPKDKISDTKEMIDRAVKDLLEIDFKNDVKINQNFSNFVNKSLSAVEMCGLPAVQYKATRKTILSEIYACRDFVIAGLKSKWFYILDVRSI